MNKTAVKIGMMAATLALVGCGADGPEDINDDNPTGGAQSCPVQASGTSGNRIVATISWPETLGVEAGTGQLVIWTKADLKFDGTSVTGEVTPCGSIVPPLQTKAAVGGHKVQPIIPDALWDMPGLPKTAAKGTISGFDPGATIQMEPASALLGAEMGDAANDEWPLSWSGLTTTDPDGDGKPGITAAPNTTDGFSAPPLGIFPDSPKAQQLFLATRSVIELQGKRDTCTTASGKAVIHKFDNHVVGCSSTAGGDCSASETDFVDTNRVVYKIESATYEMAQVPTGASCADVRAALP